MDQSRTLSSFFKPVRGTSSWRTGRQACKLLWTTTTPGSWVVLSISMTHVGRQACELLWTTTRKGSTALLSILMTHVGHQSCEPLWTTTGLGSWALLSISLTHVGHQACEPLWTTNYRNGSSGLLGIIINGTCLTSGLWTVVNNYGNGSRAYLSRCQWHSLTSGLWTASYEQQLGKGLQLCWAY